MILSASKFLLPLFLVIFALSPGFSQIGTSPRAVCESICSGDPGENIFPNGDFGHGIPNVVPGDPGLAPGYFYTQNPPPNDGSYTIANSTIGWGGFAADTWIDIEDHGPEANGYMMVVNASHQPGLFYQKEVPVCENTLYEFSMDVIALNRTPPAPFIIQPNVAFEINGNTVCSTSEIAITATWYTYRFSFSTEPGVTQVTLGLRNDAPGGYGNDLAIDNISFRACGPDIDVPATAFFCAGQPLQLNASLMFSPYMPDYYQWQVFNSTANSWDLLPGASQLSHTVTQPASGDQYRLVVAGSPANLSLPYCRAVSQPVELTLDDVSGFSISGSDTIICNGAPAMLEAGSFATYQWSTGAQSADIPAPVPGWYAVTVTTANNCPADDRLFVHEIELTAAAQTTDPHCAGYADGRIEVSGVQGGAGWVQFALNGGIPQEKMVFDSLGAGTYTVLAVDSLGCEFPIEVALIDPPPTNVSIGDDRTIRVCDSLTLEATADFLLSSYLWQPSEGLSCTTCPVPMSMPVQTTVYTVHTIDERGCPDTDSARITVLPRLDVYAPNVFRQDISENGLNNRFALFPSKSVTMIRRLEIFDRWGELVFQRKDEHPGSENLHWDGTDFRGRVLAPGVFLWVAEVEFTDGKVRAYCGDVTVVR